jgi:hypothetical protein
MSLPQIDDARIRTTTCLGPGRGTASSRHSTRRPPGRITPDCDSGSEFAAVLG